MIGAAFGTVVTALVKDLITPLIAAIVGKPDFSAIQFEINGSKFLVGDFINALVSFLLIAVAVYFFVILPVNAVIARMRRGEAPPDPVLVQPEMERGRSPLVSIPPFGRGFQRHQSLPIRCEKRGSEAAALRSSSR